MNRKDLVSLLKDLVVKLKSACSIGPQLSFKSVYDIDNNKLLVSKEITKILSSIYDGNDNPYIAIVIDIIADYESKHGSGTSSLLAYIIVMLSEIIEIEDICYINIDTITNTLSMINSTFIDVCNAMKLCINNDMPRISQETDAIDDVSWYFNDNDNDNKANSNIIWTDAMIARGLQHSFYWDYEFSTSDNQSISLPMKLAMETIIDNENKKYDTVQIVDMLANMSLKVENKENDNYNKNDTIIQLLPGLPITYCTAAKHAVIITLHDRSSICAIQDYMFKKDITISFSAIAIVEGDFEPGSLGEGGGASDQMRKFNNNRVINDDIDDFNKFLRSSSETNYLQFCRKRLEDLHVDLLIITNTYLSPSLIDIFRDSSIVVIAIHQHTSLHKLAKLSGTTIVNDILQLGPKQIGKKPISLTVLLRRQFQNQIISKDIIDGTHSYTYDGSSGVFGDPRDGIFITGYDPSNTDELVLKFQGTNSRNSKVGSIVIASPSLPQTFALADRCHRCLFRLKSIMSGSPIIPGAGIPELLFSMHLSNISLDNQEDRLRIAIQKALMSYITTVNTKNGYSWTESLERISFCKRHFYGLYNNANILEELSQLSKDQKLMNLPSPIFDPDNNPNIKDCKNNILDCLEIKVDVFSTALQCIKQLLSIVTIINTNF